MNNKIVIIGSGLGGLLCGYILAKEGFGVTILEKNKQYGGCLQTFKRNGSVFDTGVHYIGSLDEGQTLHRFFEYFGLNGKLNLKKMDENGFNKIHFEGKDYFHAMGYERFGERMKEYFPGETGAINSYISKLFEISDSLNLFNLREAQIQNLIENTYLTTSVGEYLDNLTNNKTLQSVLAGANSLYAGVPYKTSLYVHAMVNHSFIESASRLVDGSSQIADELAGSIRAMGGQVITGAEVNHLEIHGSEIKSANLKSGEKYEADIFISNVHPQRTLEMLDPDKVRRAYRERIMSIENTISNFTVYIKFKENSFKFLNYNYYYHGTGNVWGASFYNPDKWPESFLFLTPVSSKSGEFADTALLLAYMKFNEVAKWDGTKIGNRGDDYEKFKLNKAAKLLDYTEKQLPGLCDSIEAYYTSTPLTYKDYTGTSEGSLYGLLKDCKNPLRSYVPPKTKIPNLHFTGQNINLHGVLGVTIGSALTCAEFLDLNYLIGKIKQA